MDFDKLNKFLEDYYDLSMERVDMSLKGWNWGLAKFEGNSLSFEVENCLAFEVPLTNVSHTTTSKNEVTLEFHQNDDAAVNLMELRFHVPSDPSNPDSDPVQEFYKNVLNNADIIQATGDAIVTLSEVQCLTPRGRYDLKLYPSFLQLHGKTFDYKIPYTTILRLFLLPHKDGRQMFFVVSLDPPIKQGQTRYHFLILLFNKEDEMTVEMVMSEEDLASKYDDKLQKEMTGLEYELVSRIFKVITQRKITVPGSFVGDEYGKLYDFVTSKKLRVKNIGGSIDKQAVAYEEMSGSDEEGGDHDAYLQKVKAEGKQREEDDDTDSSDESFNPGDSGSEVAEEYDSNPPTTSSEDSDSDYSGGSVASGSEDSAAEERREKEREKRRQKEKEQKKEKKKSKTAKTVPEGPRKKRKSKKNKDPNAPKRPQSAYFLWLNENRENIKKENPGISVTEISKLAGEMWKEVDDKTEWEEKAKKAKEEYKIAMAEYQENMKDQGSGSESDSGKKAKSTKSAKKSPKKSPKKAPRKSEGGGGGGDYKSKEFISSEESSSDSDKPLKKKSKKVCSV
nr:hypothetical protein BaRGS_005151 [Batillaria attramentaria]